MTTTQIRNSVFETNSSSSHSVTVASGEIADFGLDKETLRKGVIEVDLKSFGWEHCRYVTLQGKLSYLLSQLVMGARWSGEAEDVSKVIKANPQIRQLLDFVKDQTGCEVSIRSTDPYFYGIDHQSVGVGLEVMRSKSELKKFLFSRNSSVTTGNDNSAPGEWISADDGTRSRGYPEKYVAKLPEDGVSFTLAFRSGDLKHLEFSSGDSELWAAGSGHEDEMALFDILDEQVVVMGATIQCQPYDNRGSDEQRARDHLFRKLRRERILIAEDAIVKLEEDPNIREWRAEYRFECVAPRDKVDEVYQFALDLASKSNTAKL